MKKTETDSTTRQTILITALALFAASGFQNVSMRQIAADAGIRASSIYNHFESKMDILDSLIDVVKNHIAQRVYVPLENDIEHFKKDPEKFFERNYLAAYDIFFSPEIADILTVIMEGQFVSESIRNFLSEEMINKPRCRFTDFFERLIQSGVVLPFSAKQLAEEYLSFSVARYYQHTLNGNIPKMSKKQEITAFRHHLRFFLTATGLHRTN